MKRKRDSDGRTFDHVSLQIMRIQAVKAVERGQMVAEVVAAFGVNEPPETQILRVPLT